MGEINKKYKDLISKIYNEGFEYEDPNRKGVIRKQIPYYNFEHTFEDGFPLIGLKQTFPKMAFNEMKAFMMGKTNLKDLEDLGVTFWRKDAYNYFQKRFGEGSRSFEDWFEMVNIFPNHSYGDLGKIYSHQIRNWNGSVDQLNNALNRLKNNPHTTKNIITMWNPSDMEDCALSPCHRSFEFIVKKLNLYERVDWFIGNASKSDFDYYYNNVKTSEQEEYFDKLNIPKYSLSIQWEQSSVDSFLGLPMNILYYSDVCYVFAHYLSMVPEGIIGNLSNVHLYDNSFSVVEEMLKRDETILNKVEIETNFPKEWTDLDDYLRQLDFNSNIKLLNYNHLGRLDVEMLAYK